MRIELKQRNARPSGFSYIEVLIAVVLVAVSLAPALEALKTGMMSATVDSVIFDEAEYVKSKLEDVLAQPFTALDAAAGSPNAINTAYSDAAGARRRRVYISRYDADNVDNDNDRFSGTDAGLLWLKVDLEGSATALTTLTAQ